MKARIFVADDVALTAKVLETVHIDDTGMLVQQLIVRDTEQQQIRKEGCLIPCRERRQLVLDHLVNDAFHHMKI